MSTFPNNSMSPQDFNSILPAKGQLEFMNNTLKEALGIDEFHLTYTNGQRMYRPSGSDGRGYELHISRAPRNLYEDEWLPILQHFGELTEMRMMLDFSGTTRGYFYASFKKLEDAQNCLEQLDQFHVKPEFCIKVSISIDNRKLRFSNLPNWINHEEMVNLMRSMTPGSTNVELIHTKQVPLLSYAIVEYIDHKTASKVRRKFLDVPLVLDQISIKVDWALPDESPLEKYVKAKTSITNKIKSVYVRNAKQVTIEEMKDTFEHIIGIRQSVKNVVRLRNSAFINFRFARFAHRCLSLIPESGLFINNVKLDISLAR